MLRTKSGGTVRRRQFVAEGRAWQGISSSRANRWSRFRTRSGNADLASRTSARKTASAMRRRPAAAADRTFGTRPADTAAITRAGEIYADREEFQRARTYWDETRRVQPGRADGYLEAATVYRDYDLYDDALRVIADARRRLTAPALFAYEAGAIYEGKRAVEQRDFRVCGGGARIAGLTGAAALDDAARQACSPRPSSRPSCASVRGPILRRPRSLGSLCSKNSATDDQLAAYLTR